MKKNTNSYAQKYMGSSVSSQEGLTRDWIYTASQNDYKTRVFETMVKET